MRFANAKLVRVMCGPRALGATPAFGFGGCSDCTLGLGVQHLLFALVFLSPPQHVVRSPTGSRWRLRTRTADLVFNNSCVGVDAPTRAHLVCGLLRVGRQICEFWYDPRATSCLRVCGSVWVPFIREGPTPGGLNHNSSWTPSDTTQRGVQSSPIGHVSKHGPRSIACVQV